MLLINEYPFTLFPSVLRGAPPMARAVLRGGADNPDLVGEVAFWQTDAGVLGEAVFAGLPQGNHCSSSIFALHIHEGTQCSGEDFSDAKGHYNPGGCPHPYHAGDLPPILASDTSFGSIAYSVFLTSRLSVQEILGKTVILHLNPDDFTTQPAGNAGKKIACGVIEAV